MSRNSKSRFGALSILALIVFAVTALPLRADSDDRYVNTINRTLPFRGGKVKIDHKFGAVVVRTQPGSNVVVKATIRSSDAELGKKIKVLTSSDGEGVTIETEYPTLHFSFGNFSYSVDYEITVPPAAPLDIHNRFGSTDVAGVQAASSINSGQGSVTMRAMRGNQVVENSFGSIEVTDTDGNLQAKNANGSVRVQGVRGSLDLTDRFGTIYVANVGTTASISNSNGNVEVHEIGTNARVNNSFGTVDIDQVHGTLDLTNGNGRVEATNVAARTTIRNAFGSVNTFNTGELTVTASNSPVEVKRVRGGANLETSFGSITLSDIVGNARVRNSNGNITASDIKGALDAETRFGSVRAERIHAGAEVDNANGSVTLAEVDGNVRAKSSFGSVFLKGVGGTVEVENANGAISVGGLRSPCREITLRTSFSGIKLAVSPSVGLNIRARTSFGHISSDIPITTRVAGDDSLDGTIGAGGCRVELTNSNGNIEITRD
jgi:hypothetical protein